MEHIDDLNWRKARRSGGNGGACVEIAQTDRVLVRDSKAPDDARLSFTPTAWQKFVSKIK
jgi:hypothetical protein